MPFFGRFIFNLALIVYFPLFASSVPLDFTIRLNETQVLRTHNSYHLASALACLTEPSLRYTHAPLPSQLALGVRGVELDLHTDLNVFHVRPDAGTSCTTLAACLALLSTWSSANARHVPLQIFLEFKQPGLGQIAAAESVALQYLGSASARFVQPRDIRRDKGSLREGAAQGWPRLRDVRGRFMVTVQTTKDDERSAAWDEFWASDERLFFGLGRAELGAEQRPSCVVVDVDIADAMIGDASSLRTLISAGVMLRIRADVDLVVDGRRRAVAEGFAHVVDTDFEEAEGAKRVLFLPRCHPSVAMDACEDGDLEEGVVVSGEGSGLFWCCRKPVFVWIGVFWPVASALVGVVLLIVAAVTKTVRRERRILAILGVGQALYVLSLRIVTDTFVRRHVVKPDDFFVAISVLLSAVVVVYFLFSSRDELNITTFALAMFSTVTLGVAIAAVIVSGAGGRRDALGYGVLETNRAFLWLAILETVASTYFLFSIAKNSSRSDGGWREVLPQSFILAARAPLLLFLAAIGAFNGILPSYSLASLGDRIVLWHALSNSALILLLFVIAIAWDKERIGKTDRTNNDLH